MLICRNTFVLLVFLAALFFVPAQLRDKSQNLQQTFTNDLIIGECAYRNKHL